MNFTEKTHPTQENKEVSASIQKRKVLSSISNKLRRIREHKVKNAQNENEAMRWAGFKINDLIMMFLHNPTGNKEFKTFYQWKKEGKTIIKGSHAALIWGQPIAAHSKVMQENEEPNEETYKLFPLCYLFSQDQVH